ncbi:MAG: flavin reductase [Candidatus Firestonebacteria bacterium RIFOXYA2_FULL_40_8]|nr:MAG: flavin reductase [Candidatus Firestonebacteria bacterium RIFOXYA2_FULL_40_8]
MNSFVKLNTCEISENPFKLIGKDWMLITAGQKGKFNTMTASWGAFGVLWNKNCCTIYVRPTRYTYNFLEKNEYYTLSFFEEKFRDALNICGAYSGKDTDKIKKSGLSPFQTGNSIAFKEAKLIIECKKIYFGELNPVNILDKKDDAAFYPKKDYHRMYIGEITECLKKDNL